MVTVFVRRSRTDSPLAGAEPIRAKERSFFLLETQACAAFLVRLDALEILFCYYTLGVRDADS